MNRSEIEEFTRNWLDAICSGNSSRFEQLVAEQAVDPGGGPGGLRAACQSRARSVYDNLAELEWRIDELVIENDRVALRWTLSGVQRGTFLGQAPTGKRITLSGVNFQRVTAGAAIEHFTLLDVAGALRQMQSDS